MEDNNGKNKQDDVRSGARSPTKKDDGLKDYVCVNHRVCESYAINKMLKLRVPEETLKWRSCGRFGSN